MEGIGLIIILAVAIALIITLIVKFKIHAFLALVIVAMFVGLTSGMPLADIGRSIENGVAGTLGFLAIIIGCGTILGKMLEESGGAECIANVLLDKLGKQNASWVMMIVGFIAGIPVFVEVGFVLLVPLVFVIAKDLGVSKIQIGIPLAVSLMIVHCIVPPHPAAMAITATLGADVGKVIIFGLLAGLPCAIIAGPIWSKFVCSNSKESHKTNIKPISNNNQPQNTPSFSATLFTILLPLLIMVSKTVITLVLPADSTFMPFISFVGNPITALLISVFYAYYSLGLAQGSNMSALLKLTEQCFSPIAGILLIIGAGGAFNGILIDSGIGQALASALSTLPISPIFLAWLIAGLLHLAVGSATVAMISAAGIVLPMLTMNPDLNREALVIAIGAGAIGWTHVTDSLFWLVKEYLGMSLTETLKKFTAATTLASFIGLGMALLINTIL